MMLFDVCRRGFCFDHVMSDKTAIKPGATNLIQNLKYQFVPSSFCWHCLTFSNFAVFLSRWYLGHIWAILRRQFKI